MDKRARQHSIWWWEPAWSRVPRIRRTVAPIGILTLSFWVRVFSVPAIVAAVFLWLIHRANPSFTVPTFILAVPFLWASTLLLQVGMHLLIPASVSVGARGISVTALGPRIRSDRVLSADLDTSESYKAWMVVRYLARNGAERTLTIGVGPGTDLEALRTLLSKLAGGSEPPASLHATPNPHHH